jgi:hypothetical protein
MSSEIRPNIRPSVVAINTTPLWLVEVMIVKGGDCPGSRVGALEAMMKDFTRPSRENVMRDRILAASCTELHKGYRYIYKVR